jgi:hypothetical protein
MGSKGETMKGKSSLPLAVPFLLLACLAGTICLAAVGSGAARVHAQPAIRFVAASGDDSGDCTDPASPCATVQYAVDQATAGDEIRVAGGSYSGVQGRPSPPGYKGAGVITQVVYISQTLSIRGGYTTTNDFGDPPNPIANPTTLDAQAQGRVLFITQDTSPSVEGLRLTGGDADDLGGSPWWTDAGGGIYVLTSTATLSNCQIFDNRTLSGYGGGLFLNHSPSTLNDSLVVGNVAWYDGGGLYLYHSPAILSSNVISDNDALTFIGGGLFLSYSDASLSDNTIANNYARDGGGLYLWYSDASLDNNTIIGNATEYWGGGLFTEYSSPTLAGSIIYDNVARVGGGLYLRVSPATLINNVIVENHATDAGSGLFVEGSSPVLLHTTLARNTRFDSEGIHITNLGSHSSTVVMSNTILVAHTTALYADTDSTARLEATLWGSGDWANETDWDGPGTILTGTLNLWDDPAFVDPDAVDYHLGASSAAIDAGVNAGVHTDIDGEPRPLGQGYDLGADEFYVEYGLLLVKEAFPEPVPAGALLTYTIRLTNTSGVILTPTVTDTLPEHVTPGGILTWPVEPLAPDEGWTKTFSVTVEQGYAGLLVNRAQAYDPQGALATTAVTSTVLCNPLEAISISAPPTGTVGTACHAIASVAPPSTSLPVVYRWQATGQEPMTHTNGLSDTAIFTWYTTGAQMITVTAWNACSEMLSATHTLTIEHGNLLEIYLPLVIQGFDSTMGKNTRSGRGIAP